MWSFKKCVTREREEGRLTKKVTKSDVVGVVAARESDATQSKKDILRVTCFLNDPYDANLFCRIFYKCIC